MMDGENMAKDLRDYFHVLLEMEENKTRKTNVLLKIDN